MTQPVGFDGELTKMPRVRPSHAANSRSRSSRQPPSGRGSSATSRGSPPMIDTAAAIFGHTGATITRLSPASISVCATSISAFIAELVTAIALGADVGRRVKPAQVFRDRRAQLGQPGLIGVEGVAGATAVSAASRMKSGVGRSPSPYHSGMTAGSPMPSAEISAIREAGRPRTISREGDRIYRLHCRHGL